MRKNKKRKLVLNFLLIQIIALSASGCNLLPESDSVRSQNVRPDGFDKSDLETNRKLWRTKEIMNYDFVSSIFTGGLSDHPRAVLIRVRNGRNISTEVVSKTDDRSPGIYKPFDTVDKMFDTIEEESKKERVEVFIENNKEFGYPQSIKIRKGAIDGHISMEILKFEVID